MLLILFPNGRRYYLVLELGMMCSCKLPSGEGAPDYAALYMNRSVKPLPFPQLIPSLVPYKVDPETG